MIEEVARIMRQNTFLDCYVKCGRDTSDIVADGAFGGFGILICAIISKQVSHISVKKILVDLT